jgi:hypothetical protein
MAQKFLKRLQNVMNRKREFYYNQEQRGYQSSREKTYLFMPFD